MVNGTSCMLPGGDLTSQPGLEKLTSWEPGIWGGLKAVVPWEQIIHCPSYI